MSARTVVSMLVGGSLGLVGAIVGYLLAGIPGEIVGVACGGVGSFLFGMWNGARA